MSFVKKTIKKSALWKKCKPYVRELQIKSSEKKQFLAEAEEGFKSNPEHGNLSPLLRCISLIFLR